MKYVLASLAACVVIAATAPAWTQTARIPNESRAVMGPDAHDGILSAPSASGPVYHSVSRHARVHHRRVPHKQTAGHPRVASTRHASHVFRTDGITAEQLNRAELARIQGGAEVTAPAPMAIGP